MPGPGELDAIVLVGGRGTRLLPLTAARHKSLVPLLNRPAFDYLLDWLERGPVARVVLALGVGNEDLAGAYPEGMRGSLRIVHEFERERLESGGAIRNAVERAGIEGRFVVVNGDIYTDCDLDEMVRAHESAEADLTLGLYPVEDPSSFGVAVVGEGDAVTGFVEKPPPGTEASNLANAGVWVFEPGLVGEIPPGPVRVEETLFPSLVARNRPVFGQRMSGLWADLGTPERYLALTGALLGGGSRVDDSARTEGATRIVESVIGAGAVIEGGADIMKTILWEGTHIGRGARLEECVLADGVQVGEGAVLSRCVAGAGAIIAAGAEPPAGARIRAGERYDGADAR